MTAQHPIDVHVGKRMAQRRMLLGMSQIVLGKNIGVSFRQIQKYERGLNRLSASRLFEAAHVLKVPVDYFFGTMSKADARTPTRRASRDLKCESADPALDPLTQRETLKLMRAYYRIQSPKIRASIGVLIKGLASEELSIRSSNCDGAGHRCSADSAGR
ncbi:helix-turn-helix transcriptional regulator [Reyranella sp.]|uniref:helix-turn-helix domain-containing protein n=1 Tax=Reyranella sp. TaxID=1929291 RepID=UPI00120CE49F|nr:helix-turn-helix transcriptional regulator [Reyranella sp.]TAJ85396.1 MAG: XRE family transcriptional regulator [Reyranella sp.]